MLAYTAFKILPTIAALAYTIYLACIMSNPARIKTKLANIKSKHKKSEPYYDVRLSMYSPRYLVGWLLVTTFLVFDIAFDVYEAIYTLPLSILLPRLVIGVAILLSGLYFITSALKKKG